MSCRNAIRTLLIAFAFVTGCGQAGTRNKEVFTDPGERVTLILDKSEGTFELDAGDESPLTTLPAKEPSRVTGRFSHTGEAYTLDDFGRGGPRRFVVSDGGKTLTDGKGLILHRR
jgi:hypothetical protein